MANSRLCSIPDCGKPHDSHGFCRPHYARWKRHGNPLAGRQTSPGEPKAHYQNVVLAYEGEDCLVWPYYGAGNGAYALIYWGGKLQLVHRLVCEAINGPAPTSGHQAAHLCGNGHLGCVSPRHLTWKTKSENQMDKLTHGTMAHGDRNAKSKLTADSVCQIRQLSGRLSQRELGKMFGVSQTAIGSVLRGKTWSHVPDANC